MSISLFILGAETDLDGFLGACTEFGLALRREEQVESFDDLELEVGTAGEEEVLGAKESEGRLCIWGDESSSFCMQPDIALLLSRRLAKRVAMGVAHSSSGTYMFVLADSGRLIRLFYAGYLGAPGTVEAGQPLSCEGLRPLDAPNGEGIILALTSCGFDCIQEALEGPFATVACPLTDLRIAKRELSALLGEHARNAPRNYKPQVGIRISVQEEIQTKDSDSEKGEHQ